VNKPRKREKYDQEIGHETGLSEKQLEKYKARMLGFNYQDTSLFLGCKNLSNTPPANGKDKHYGILLPFDIAIQSILCAHLHCQGRE